MTDMLARGILIGGSIGALAGLFGMDPARAMLLGLVAGFLAGLTRYKLQKKRKEKDR